MHLSRTRSAGSTGNRIEITQGEQRVKTKIGRAFLAGKDPNINVTSTSLIGVIMYLASCEDIIKWKQTKAQACAEDRARNKISTCTEAHFLCSTTLC